MKPSYQDQIVVITGASSGIGYATARRFAERGAIVVAVARREEHLKRLLDECRANSARSIYLCGDLGRRDFAEGVITQTLERFGHIDVLVNNAAITKHKQIYEIGADEVDEVMRINFLAGVWTTLAAIPSMLARGRGTIVNVSSFAAKVAPPREAIYAASKAALSSFSEGLWNDLAGSGIHVSLIHPGPIDTEIWSKLDEPTPYTGHKYPASLVADAIIEAIENRRFELTIPRRNPQLVLARLLRLLAPSILRKAMARRFPVPDKIIESARARAKRPS